MTPQQITELLRNRGASYAAFAKSLGVSHTSIRRVVFGESKSRRVANAIAIFLGRSVDDLWPGQYPKRYRRTAPNDMTRAQIDAAARMANAKAA